MNDGADVALGAPFPPDPAAAHAVVASSSAAANAISTLRMAVTS
jgi:hypothetical protein